MTTDRANPATEGRRAEPSSFWPALVIALAPIPLALLISWALGAPPWRARAGSDAGPGGAPAHEAPMDPMGH